MDEFSILTNRKRAIVALVHSVVFLAVALRQMVVVSPASGIWLAPSVPLSTWILCGTFTVVSSILFYLFAISHGWLEKLYFGLCTASATSGLLRTAAGDQAFHAALLRKGNHAGGRDSGWIRNRIRALPAGHGVCRRSLVTGLSARYQLPARVVDAILF